VARSEFEFRQRVLYDASTIIFGATVLLILAEMLLGGARPWQVLAVDGFCLAGGVAGRIAHLRKQPRAGWAILSGFLVAAITWNLVYHGGIDAPSIVQYVVLIAVVARILGARAAAIAAVACLAVLGTVVLAQTAGLLPDDRLRSLPWRHALTAAITVALLGVLMWHATRLDTMQHAERERVEEFARASGGWFWETDSAGRLFWVSESASLALGIARASLPGKTLPELDESAEGANGAQSRGLLKAIQRGDPIRSVRLLRRDAEGRERWFELSGLPNVASDGKLIGYRGVALDVAHRERPGTPEAIEPAKGS
jgi:PAS domain S-box-containing protein